MEEIWGKLRKTEKKTEKMRKTEGNWGKLRKTSFMFVYIDFSVSGYSSTLNTLNCFLACPRRHIV